MVWIVYMLRTSGNTLYVGQTNNLARRLKQHAAKNAKAAKYMRMFSGFSLVYTKEFGTKSEALKYEAHLKGLPKAAKEALCP